MALALLSAFWPAGFSVPAASAAGVQRVLYVDAGHPAASSAGPGTVSKPFPTINDALAAHPDSGVTVIVAPGTYRERVVLPATGVPGSPVILHAPHGAVLDGADPLAGPGHFVPYAGSVWVASSVPVAPRQVFASGQRLYPSAQLDPALVEPSSFAWFPGVGLAVNVGGDPAAHDVAVTRRTHGFLLQGKRHVVIEGFTIRRVESKGIEVVGGSKVRLTHNVVEQSFAGGIAVENSSGVEVLDNRVADCNHHGIEFRGGVTGSRIERNESAYNAHLGEAWATGIYLAHSPGNIVAGNRVHHNQDSGVEVQSASNGTLVRQNVSWANGDHGFAVLFATGTRFINNTAWGNATEGFSVEGGSTATLLRNNISVNLALEPGAYCLFVDATSLAGLDADHDVYWNVADQPPVRLGAAVYPNVAAMQAATGMGLHSYSADPRFVDAANGDFHLRGDSPAIDAADSGVSGWNETDADTRWRVDEPAAPNAGSGPVDYADRGAFEYQGAVLAVGGGAWHGVQLRGTYPNPARRTVSFGLELPGAARVRVSVFDVLGREVWSHESDRPGGRSELGWSLSGRSGSRVPNGVYLARVSVGDATGTTRFVVVD